MNCKSCCCSDFETVRCQAADGHWFIFRECCNCKRNWDNKQIAKEKYPGWQNLCQVRGSEPQTCARCGRTFAQLHHYFPRKLAEIAGQNAEAWPKEYLCDACHKLWHDNVTPGLVSKNWKGAKNGKF